jgi:hypothetical protein
VEEQDMERMLQASTAPSDWLKALENQVLARGHKGQDNYSAIAVWCKEPNEDEPDENVPSDLSGLPKI